MRYNNAAFIVHTYHYFRKNDSYWTLSAEVYIATVTSGQFLMDPDKMTTVKSQYVHTVHSYNLSTLIRY